MDKKLSDFIKNINDFGNIYIIYKHRLLITTTWSQKFKEYEKMTFNFDIESINSIREVLKKENWKAFNIPHEITVDQIYWYINPKFTENSISELCTKE